MTHFWDRVSTFRGADNRIYILIWYPIAVAWWVRAADSSWQLLNDGGVITEEST